MWSGRLWRNRHADNPCEWNAHSCGHRHDRTVPNQDGDHYCPKPTGHGAAAHGATRANRDKGAAEISHRHASSGHTTGQTL